MRSFDKCVISITPLRNQMVLDVVTPKDAKAPIREQLPDEKLVIIDWRGEDGERPTPEEVSVPITYQMQEYHGGYVWGSAVKRDQTVGVMHDFLRDLGLLKYAEDGIREPTETPCLDNAIFHPKTNWNQVSRLDVLILLLELNLETSRVQMQ